MLTRILFVVLFTVGCAAITTAQTATLKSYYNPEHKAGFKYPANWKLSKQEGSLDNEPGFNALAGLDPAASALRGQLKQAAVTLAMAATDEATCKAFNIGNINKEPDKPRIKKIGNLTFYNIFSSDGAAGSIGITDYYRTFYNGRCYELSFMKFRSNQPKDDRYVKAMDQQFDAILRSFYLSK